MHIPWPFTPACFNNLYDNYNVHKVFSPTFGFSFFLLIRWAKMFTGSWFDQFFIRIFPDSTSRDTKALCFKHGKSWVNWIARNMMFEYKTRIPHRKKCTSHTTRAECSNRLKKSSVLCEANICTDSLRFDTLKCFRCIRTITHGCVCELETSYSSSVCRDFLSHSRCYFFSR